MPSAALIDNVAISKFEPIYNGKNLYNTVPALIISISILVGSIA
jgi:hypothetical protein